MACRGSDDKASAPVERISLMSAAANNSARPFAANGSGSRESGHDWHCEILTTAVNHRFKIASDSRDDLHSSGPDGIGQTCVSAHNGAIVASNGLKHSFHICQHLLRLANNSKDNLPTNVLFETDGGPEHSLTFSFITCFDFGLFLVGMMDKLTFLQ